MVSILAPVALGFAAAALGSAGLVVLATPGLRACGALLRLLRKGAGGSGAGGGSATFALRLLAIPASRVRALAPPPPDLRARIAAAGRPGGLGPRELMGAKVAAALAAGGLGAAISGAAPGRLGVLVATGAPVAGFLGPDLWLARRADARARRVRRELPAMLDLLRVTVEAGGSLPAALEAVAGRTEGPLAIEWRGVATEAALGVPLMEALTGMADRLPQSEVSAFVAALGRAIRHGAPLADTLAAQARDARFALRRRVQEDAARAGPKIQLVVALLLVPSVLLLVAAALAAALLDPAASRGVLGG